MAVLFAPLLTISIYFSIYAAMQRKLFLIQRFGDPLNLLSVCFSVFSTLLENVVLLWRESDYSWLNVYLPRLCVSLSPFHSRKHKKAHTDEHTHTVTHTHTHTQSQTQPHFLIHDSLILSLPFSLLSGTSIASFSLYLSRCISTPCLHISLYIMHAL